MSPEDFKTLLNHFNQIPMERIAEAFSTTRATLYSWRKKGIPKHNKFANMLAIKMSETISGLPGCLEMNKLMDISSLFTITLNDIPEPTCIVKINNVACSKPAVAPTLLCSQHLRELCNGKRLCDYSDNVIDMNFMKYFTNWSEQRCAAYASTNKTRCRCYAVTGSHFCPFHKDVLRRNGRIYAEINGIPQYVGIEGCDYKIKTNMG